METKQLMTILTDLLEDMKAEDIDVIDVSERLKITDYFIVCTATSSTHLRAVVDYIDIEMKRLDRLVNRIEGKKEGKWILMDFGDVVLHVFDPFTREEYNLRKLHNEMNMEDKAQEPS